MATKAVYVLETCWLWDNANTEYGTITVEEPDEGFEDLLNPALPRERKDVLLQEIRKLAEGLDRSIQGKNALVRLYRVEWKDGHKWPRVIAEKKTGRITLKVRMIPICDFDENGNPIPVSKDI